MIIDINKLSNKLSKLLVFIVTKGLKDVIQLTLASHWDLATIDGEGNS